MGRGGLFHSLGVQNKVPVHIQVGTVPSLSPLILGAPVLLGGLSRYSPGLPLAHDCSLQRPAVAAVALTWAQCARGLVCPGAGHPEPCRLLPARSASNSGPSSESLDKHCVPTTRPGPVLSGGQSQRHGSCLHAASPWLGWDMRTNTGLTGTVVCG